MSTPTATRIDATAYPLFVNATVVRQSRETARVGQVQKMRDELLSELEVFDAERADAIGAALRDLSKQGGLTKGVLSFIIGRTIRELREYRAAARTAEIPAGRYATKTDDAVNFYYINAEGIIKRYASDTLHGITRVESNAARAAILALGLDASGLLFATETRKCRRCGRRLTAETTLATVHEHLGYGPDCFDIVTGG